MIFLLHPHYLHAVFVSIGTHTDSYRGSAFHSARSQGFQPKKRNEIPKAWGFPGRNGNRGLTSSQKQGCKIRNAMKTWGTGLTMLYLGSSWKQKGFLSMPSQDIAQDLLDFEIMTLTEIGKCYSNKSKPYEIFLYYIKPLSNLHSIPRIRWNPTKWKLKSIKTSLLKA